MTRAKRESVPTTFVATYADPSPSGTAEAQLTFDSRHPVVLEAHERDMRWFRAHPGKRVRVRVRIEGEFLWYEALLPPFIFVESTLLPDGRISCRPLFLQGRAVPAQAPALD